mgnify:CR=1 FL=1
MGRKAKSEPKDPIKRPPATTPKGREDQLILLAVELAEQQLLDGTASSQTINHYLKMGSSRERLEQERLERENNLLDAKVEAMESVKKIEQLYETALDAMRTYAGYETTDQIDD